MDQEGRVWLPAIARAISAIAGILSFEQPELVRAEPDQSNLVPAKRAEAARSLQLHVANRAIHTISDLESRAIAFLFLFDIARVQDRRSPFKREKESCQATQR